MTFAFLAWYLLYVLLSTYAPDFMATEVFGNVNLGPPARPGPVRDARSSSRTCTWRTRTGTPTRSPTRCASGSSGTSSPGQTPAGRRPALRGGHPCLTLLAADATIGEPAINISIFGGFVLVTLFITFRASRNNKSAADYYAAGRNISGTQNGLAIAGDYLSAASFLGIAGAIAVYGYDGFLYSIGFLVAWLVALLLVAELMRNTARFTMADVLAFRMRERPVRMAAAISTLAVSLFYLLAQMAGAGGLVALLLGVSGDAAEALVVTLVGALMIFYVLVGGMRGTTYVQMIKATLLIVGALRDDRVGARPSTASTCPRCSGGAQEPSPSRAVDVLAPGAQYGADRRRRSWTSSRSAWRWSWGRRGCRTCSCASTRCPTAKDARTLGRLGHLADRHLLPVQPGHRLRRRGAGRGRRRSWPHRARSTRPRRCWPSSSAARCCSASSPASRSPPSSRWWPA